MSKFFAMLGVALILVGVALFAMKMNEPQSAAMRRSVPQNVGLVQQVVSFAQQANAPLSIVFGFFSLYYSRKRYLAERDRVGGRRS